MKKRVATIITYLLLTFCLMWLLPFYAGSFLSVSLDSGKDLMLMGIVLMVVFAIQMVITYKMRCAWAWLWVNAVCWLVFFLMYSLLYGCEAMIILLIFIQATYIFAIANFSKLLFVFAVCLYFSSFVIQFILEYRRRKAESAAETVLAVGVENSEE